MPSTTIERTSSSAKLQSAILICPGFSSCHHRTMRELSAFECLFNELFLRQTPRPGRCVGSHLGAGSDVKLDDHENERVVRFYSSRRLTRSIEVGMYPGRNRVWRSTALRGYGATGLRGYGATIDTKEVCGVFTELLPLKFYLTLCDCVR